MADADEFDSYEPDKLGEWSERKIAIVSKYAAAYSSILAGQRLKHFYIDGFAGGPIALRKETGEQIATTARRILEIEPPFAGYYLLDADAGKVAAMASVCAGRPQARMIHGDANKLLPGIFETIRYNDFNARCVFSIPIRYFSTGRCCASPAEWRRSRPSSIFPLVTSNATCCATIWPSSCRLRLCA